MRKKNVYRKVNENFHFCTEWMNYFLLVPKRAVRKIPTS